MKGKFSVNRLLHNDRVMIVFSVLLAVVIWAIVSFGPANTTERTLTIPFTVDLTDTVAGHNDLRVIGENAYTATVVVKGARSVIFNLNSDDISIVPSLSDIQGQGTSRVILNASKTGKNTEYSIVSISPPIISVNCDYWETETFLLKPDISKVNVADAKNQQVGDVLLDTNTAPNGMISVEGPRTVIDTIKTMVARVDEDQTIEKTSRFTASVLALSADGKEIDLSNCKLASTIDVTVPVWVQRVVPLTYQLVNMPSGFSAKKLIELPYDSITLVGEEDELNASADSAADLGTFDFDRLTPEDADTSITLSVPATVKVLEGTTVSVHLNIEKYGKKTLDYSVKGLQDVTVENLPEGKTITLQSQKLSDIILYGNPTSLKRISANDLKLTLDAGSNTGTGSVRYTVRITVPKYKDVWVYYGKEPQSGYKLYGTLN